MEADLPDGNYRARTVEPGGSVDFRIENGIIPEIILDATAPSLGADGKRGIITASNTGPVGRTLVIEDRRWAADALTAHEVTTLQAFRDLFADTVLRPGDQVEIRRVTFLFTDVKGSSDLYNRVGDARAYGLVREHYAVLTGAIRRHDGAVVKTIGDAVMAAFHDPVAALGAALRIRDDIEAFNRNLATELETDGVAIVVRLGLHTGPCIAVTLNDRLDYFGRTVNLAARLEAQSQGGDIVLSEALAAEHGVTELLDGLHATEETAMVKGFSEPVRIRRIEAHMPNLMVARDKQKI
jgi:class 3 adenylate cyclase